MLSQKDIPLLKAFILKESKEACDADPEILADYVIALVSSVSDIAQMKDLLLHELKDFLREHETFVGKLVNAINTRSYIPRPPPPVRSRYVIANGISDSKLAFNLFRQFGVISSVKVNATENASLIEFANPFSALSASKNSKLKLDLDSSIFQEDPSTFVEVLPVQNSPPALDHDRLKAIQDMKQKEFEVRRRDLIEHKDKMKQLLVQKETLLNAYFQQLTALEDQVKQAMATNNTAAIETLSVEFTNMDLAMSRLEIRPDQLLKFKNSLEPVKGHRAKGNRAPRYQPYTPKYQLDTRSKKLWVHGDISSITIRLQDSFHKPESISQHEDGILCHFATRKEAEMVQKMFYNYKTEWVD